MKRILQALVSILIASSMQVKAQDLRQFKKSANEAPHPVMEMAPPTVSVMPTEMKGLVQASSGHSIAPEYGPIHSEVRWYALENAANPAYWEAVDISHIWVELEPGYSLNKKEIAAWIAEFGLGKVTRQSPDHYRNNYYVIELPEANVQKVLDMVRAAHGVPGLRFVEPCVRYKRMSNPNDPLWEFQWGPFVIDAMGAWEYTTGGSWNVIAVIDDAVDWNHPDLFDQVWYGWDYGMNDADPSPDHFTQKHGSHVTGTIAASINNGTGIAGMVNDTIFFAKVTDGTYDPEVGNFVDAAIIDAIYDVAEIERISIVNMSLGGGAPSAALEQACNHAWNSGKLLVVASGNEGQGQIAFPAAYEACMAVGAVGADGNQMYFAAYSNYGNAQEIVAPGGDFAAGFGILSTVLFSEYEGMEGTSMACPHVAGVAGLMKAVNPSLSNFEMRGILNATATDYGNPGWDIIFGFGMVNAALAVQEAAGVVASTVNHKAPGMHVYPNPVRDALYIDLEGEAQTGILEVRDLSGRVLMSQNLTARQKLQVNVNALADGVYLLSYTTTQTGSGQGATRRSAKFVKH